MTSYSYNQNSTKIEKESDLDLSFVGKKKRKNRMKPKETKSDSSDEENTGARFWRKTQKVSQDDTDMRDETIDLSLPLKKKKAKRKINLADLESTNNSNIRVQQIEGGLGESEELHTYQQLLSRLMELKKLASTDAESATEARIKLVLPPPLVYRFGRRKTAFVNFMEICQRMKRLPSHVIAFFKEECGCPCSVDGEKKLILRGVFKGPHIERVLRNFLKLYVFCYACKSPHTILQRKERLTFLRCDQCEAATTVPSFK